MHRRYVRLLRNQVEKGTPILLTQSDLDKFKDLVHSTNEKLKRHKGLYKLTLHALNRPKEETQLSGVKGVIGYEEIDIIERTLAKAERRGIYDTIKGTIIWYCRKNKFMSSKASNYKLKPASQFGI